MESKIIRLSCNVDDMTAEDVAFACEVFFNNKANDVYCYPVSMKKNRLGTMINIICNPDDKDKFIGLIFKYTSTIGVKEELISTHVLESNTSIVNTNFGPIHLKVSKGYGVIKEKYDYDDLKNIANKNNISISEVKKNIKRVDS